MPAAERPVLGVFNPVFFLEHYKLQLSQCPFAAIPISAQGDEAF